MRIYVLAGIGLAVLGAIVSSTLTSSNTSVATAHAASTSSAPDEAAVERTRKTVRMLDDIYKTAVVLITEHYVHDEDDLSAGSAAAVWFDIIEEKGWHSARLVDATGRDRSAVADGMDRVNPVVIPRNHRVDEALRAATDGDLGPFERLLAAVTDPFVLHPGDERLAEPAPEAFTATFQTFCGT